MRRQEVPAHTPMQPFSNPSPHLEVSVQALNILNNFPVQIRNPNFKGMRHRELVSVHQEFVGKSGTDLEELHSSKLVGLFHKWNKVGPAFQNPLTGIVR